MSFLFNLRLPLLLASFALAFPAHAQNTGSGTASVGVVSTLNVTNTSDLEFGKIISNGTGAGRVIINARTGVRTGNANVTLFDTTGFGRGTFLVEGEPNTTVNLITTSPIITLTGPGVPMTVTRLRVSRNGAGQRTLPRNYNILGDGDMEIGVGGRLTVGNNQAPGSYSGTFDLIVTYL